MNENMYVFKSIIVAFIAAAIAGPIVLPMLRKLKIGQNVREYGPQSHLKKNGTPTMGGIIIFIGILVGVVVSGSLTKDTLVLLIATFGFGLIGFLDDYLIVARGNNDGLNPKQKIIGQFLLALGLAIYRYKTLDNSGLLMVPFLNGSMINIGLLYIPFMVFVMVGIVNSVNLTDGLDGLASSITAIVMVFFIMASMKYGNVQITTFAATVMGGCLGFLIYNRFPAKVFMGDVGSMGLGGAVSGLALLLDMTLFIPIVGGIYLAEALSVIIQVSSYKFRKKRVFLMSPLHHHYEQKGWKETKVVLVFRIVCVLLIVLGVLGLN